MNKFIILGCGYIGTNIANYIVNHYNDEVYVLGIENEYNKYLNSKVRFISKRIEQIGDEDSLIFKNAIVIDAVGNTNATNTSKNSSTIFLQNSSNKIDLIRKISIFKTRKYIFLSSGGTVYADSEIPHNEDEKLDPQTIYALEKTIEENYLKIFSCENGDFDYLILRLSNPFGGVTSSNKKQGIIDVAISKIKKDEILEFYGELDNIRDYIYIENLSEYIYKLAISDIKNEIYNVGSGYGTSINEIFNDIQKLYNKKLKIEVKRISTINIRTNILNVNKLKKVVHVDKVYSVIDGIRKNIELNNY